MKYLKILLNRRSLDTLIFFVTSKCNFRCKTCFYWKSLNRPGDLELQEIDSFSRSLPHFNVLLLSGGEPFLRDDLPEIIRIFCAHNRIKVVSIPTTAYFSDRIASAVARILLLDPGLQVNVRLSLDGLQETHDAIRNFPGSFAHCIKTHEALRALAKKHPLLRIGVNTTVCMRTIDGLDRLSDFVTRQLGIDDHSMEIMRGDPSDPACGAITDTCAEAALNTMIRSLRHRAGEGGTGFKKRFRTLLSAYCYSIQRDTYCHRAHWPFNCYAGRTIAAVYPNGAVAPCELLEPVANLRDHGYDFMTIMRSAEWKNTLEAIARRGCFCTHRCFIDASVTHHLRTLLAVFSRAVVQGITPKAHKGKGHSEK
ncbi:MAG: radical SAM protein [Candidatus Aureabacteria bacterium]|nr:radical SAM protein [Candidatus Auribacterota bacterium]